MKHGKKYKPILDDLRRSARDGQFERTMSIHTNRPDTCTVCVKEYSHGYANTKLKAEEMWDEAGFVVCRNCGHVAIQGRSDIYKINEHLTKLAEESWEKVIS